MTELASTAVVCGPRRSVIARPLMAFTSDRVEVYRRRRAQAVGGEDDAGVGP